MTVEFGAPLRDGSATHGQHHLWVFGAEWVARSGDHVMATSNDSREVMAHAIGKLDGRCVESVALDRHALRLRANLAGAISLEVLPGPDPEMEHWMLFLPDGSVLCAGPGTELVREPS